MPRRSKKAAAPAADAKAEYRLSGGNHTFTRDGKRLFVKRGERVRLTEKEAHSASLEGRLERVGG